MSSIHIEKLFKPIVVKWLESDECISEWPPIIIHSPIVQAANVIIDLKLAKYFHQDLDVIRKKIKTEEEFVMGQMKTTILYNTNRYYLEYFVCERKSLDKVALCKFLKTHVSTKPLLHQKKTHCQTICL